MELTTRKDLYGLLTFLLVIPYASYCNCDVANKNLELDRSNRGIIHSTSKPHRFGEERLDSSATAIGSSGEIDLPAGQ